MATPKQYESVKRVCETLKVLNKTLDNASDAGVTIELDIVRFVSARNPNYILKTSEIRETVVPQ